LQEERSPSWHARDVAVRRAEQLGIACLLVSPVPSLRTLHHTSGVVLSVGDEIENSQWPEIRIIDRRLDERWASSLLSSELIEQLRDHTRRIVCVLNVKGRAKLLACGNCRDLVRCDTCDAAMSMFGIGELLCPRCAHKRPAVCMGCGSGKLAVIKAGVSRLREELAAAAGWRVEDVVEVVASSSGKTDVEIDQTKMLFVGTEAALHRVRDVDTVIFLDIDQEISAPRYRASEISLTLVIHAARLVARSGSQGLVLVQTFLADHALLRGLSSHDLSEFISGEMSRRKLLSLPPFGALAQLSGNGIDAVADDLRSNILLQVSATAHESVLVKAQSWDELADGLAASITTTTSKSARIKTQVDPPRA
jgi:primosomal protein N' (replication factor Y) (superfamily II helicase)